MLNTVIASSTALVAAFALAACGSSSEPTPNTSPSEPVSSSPAAPETSPYPAGGVDIDAPDTGGIGVGLHLNLNSDTATGATKDGIVINSGGTVNVGIGGPSALAGDRIILFTVEPGDKFKVQNNGNQTMKAGDGASSGLFSISGISTTTRFGIVTMTAASFASIPQDGFIPDSVLEKSSGAARFQVIVN